MQKVYIGCSMLANEIRTVMEELNLKNELKYIDAALHVDLDALEEALKIELERLSPEEQPVLFIGTKCHPDMGAIADKYGAQILTGANCIELILGDKMAELDNEAKTFYLTDGWLKNWKKIFIEGLKWDQVDAKQNFGFYDRILLIDTGLTDIDDEQILEFFEYTQIPIEAYPTTLANLKARILKAVE